MLGMLFLLLFSFFLQDRIVPLMYFVVALIKKVVKKKKERKRYRRGRGRGRGRERGIIPHSS